MKKILFLSIVASLFIPSIVIGQEVKTSLTFNTPFIKDAVLNTDYVSFATDDMILETEEGSPNIPFRYVRLIIPSNSKVISVDVDKSEMQNISLSKKIEPAQPPIPIGRTDNRKYIEANAAIYSSNNVFPENMAEVVDVKNFNGSKVVFLKVYPFQYYPKDNTLEFYKKIGISLSYEISTDDSKQALAINKTASHVDDQILQGLVDNKDDVNKFSSISISSEATTSVSRAAQNGLGYKYVIITSEALVPAFERFANWKRRKGMSVGIVTMEYIKAQYTGDLVSGIYDNAGKVRQFLKKSYEAGTQYVLLGGDENVVPIRYATASDNSTAYDYNIPTDLYYAEFTGNWNVDGDTFYGEHNGDNPSYTQQIYVGRLLCSTKEHVDNWTYKALLYEKNPGRGDYSYLRKLFFTQADQLQDRDWAGYVSSKLSSFTTKNVFNEMVNGVKNANSTTLPNYPSGTDVINEFNKNYGLVSFMGHGCPTDVALATVGYNNNNYTKLRVYTYDNIKQDRHGTNEYSNGGALKNMTNDGYPNINYSVSCDNIPYDKLSIYAEDRVDDSFGEVVTSTYRTGSVAFLGNTRYGWIDNSKTLFGYFADAVSGGNLSLGAAEAVSKTYLNTNSWYDRFLVLTHNLIGCPEMKMWTTTPSKFSSASVTRSGNTVKVESKVAGSKICIMSSTDNGSSYYQVVENTTTAAQACSFSNVPTSYTVTITKGNYIPHMYASDVTLSGVTYSSGSYFMNGGNFTFNNVAINGTTNLHLEPIGYFTINTGSLSISGSSVFSIE